MEKLDYVFSRIALDNLVEITNYYEENQKGLGYQFVMAMEKHLENLLFNPKIGRYGRVSNTREFVLQGFPFILIYRVKSKKLEVLQMFHQLKKYPA